jgi:hypothetical protein
MLLNVSNTIDEDPPSDFVLAFHIENIILQPVQHMLEILRMLGVQYIVKKEKCLVAERSILAEKDSHSKDLIYSLILALIK